MSTVPRFHTDLLEHSPRVPHGPTGAQSPGSTLAHWNAVPGSAQIARSTVSGFHTDLQEHSPRVPHGPTGAQSPGSTQTYRNTVPGFHTDLQESTMPGRPRVETGMIYSCARLPECMPHLQDTDHHSTKPAQYMLQHLPE